MNIIEALKKYPDIETDLLLGNILKKPKEFLYLSGETKLTKAQALKFEDLCAERIQGIPIAYLVGYKFFYGMKFKVSKDVLIPRPETEWLVGETLKIIGQTNMSVLDVGTGSGCIAISIANHSRAKVTASDISKRALSIARSNSKATNQIKFIQSNLFKNVRSSFDIIIANLPYVPASDYQKLFDNLKYEPKLALTDGTDDFVLIKDFILQSKNHLNPAGKILIETDPASITALLKIAKSEFPKKKITIHKDQSGLARFITIY